MSALRSASRPSAAAIVLRGTIVGLALGTAYIHSTLGGLLFTLNAAGYVALAAAMVVPVGPAIRYRWLVRAALIGYALTTIVGWAVQGPYYSTAYLAKAIEVALIVVVAIDFVRADGGPIALARRELTAALGGLERRFGQAGA